MTRILIITLAASALANATPGGADMKLNPLTPAEERVIVHKGTEMPFTGEFHDFHGDGTYVCKRCDARLYESYSKFDSGCGWPSFDDEIPGAVKRQTDADGRRTEILCARCDAHLGHVFSGEGFTPKNTRHCVNSVSLKFVPAKGVPVERAIFAGGCFWGVEYHFQGVSGVIRTRVGYIGGKTEKPTYEQVCSHATGHAEALEVTFDPAKVSFGTLARLFFEIHDPTQLNRQGPDVGDQYRSAIFCTNEAQKVIAEKLIGELKGKGLDVVTRLEPVAQFWPAEDYHQQYYARKGSKPYCHVRVKRF